MSKPASKILIATGGSGGHIYPALALAEELRDAGIEYLFAGGQLSKNPYFKSDSEPYQDIRTGASWQEGFQIARGIFDSLKMMKVSQVGLVVAFGSYPTFPLLAAACFKKIPIILFAADSVPGRVIRWFSPFSAVTAVHFPEAKNQLYGATCPVFMPLRKGYRKNSVAKGEALNYFGLTGTKPVCLVVGGSKGADFLNKIAPAALESMKKGVEVIHIAGSSEQALVVESAYQQKNLAACVKAFEPRMDLAWSAASMACSRAGAGAIAEALEFEVPAVLIPYPFAKDGHQDKNADFFVAEGAGVKLPEKGLEALKLAEALNGLLELKPSFIKKDKITLIDLILRKLK